MNGKLVLGMLLLVIGFSFAAPNISWSINTPGNNSNYSGDETMFNMTSNESMGATDNFININGVNYTCGRSADTLSCNRTLGYFDKVYNQTYTVNGFANISTIYASPLPRIVNYYGCGFVNAEADLLFNIGSATYTTTCLNINASNIALYGNGKTITVDNTTSAISSTTKTGILIDNVEVIGGAWGILFLDTNNSIIDGAFLTGVGGSNNGISLGDSNNNNITNSMISGYGYGVYMAASNGNNVSHSYMTDNAVGILAGDNGNIIHLNSIYLNTGDGIILSSPTDAAIDLNEIYGNPIGVQVSNSNTSVFWRNHYFNNSVVDYYMTNTNNVSYLNFILTDEYDNIMGDHVNSTIISSLDYVAYNDSYSISANSFGTIPTGYSKFRGKVIELDDGVLSSDAILDEIIFHWNSSDAVGYDESKLTLWKEVFPGTFTLTNSSANITGNYFELTNVNVSGWARYGILYNSTVVPPNVPGNVSNAEALAISNNIVIFGVLFMILFMIVGSFGLSKFYNFNELFVPLMVAVFITILAAGLFL